METTSFITDYNLQLKEIKADELSELTGSDFLTPTSKQTVLGELHLQSTDVLYQQMEGHDIVNALFDITLNFGEEPEHLALIDDDLIMAYTYTAYVKFFTDIIEPHFGKGFVYGIIHGGTTKDGDVIQPFLQLIFLLGKNHDTTTVKHTRMAIFNEQLAAIEASVVNFMHNEYPKYVTGDTWVELYTWDHTFTVTPLHTVPVIKKEEVDG